MASVGVTVEGIEDFGRALHEEIERLPERYRFPVVLCDLEGCTHELAARRLGCPVGTVKSRLTRGRERLRSRLVRRGLAPSAGLIGAMLSAETAQAAVPTSLAEVTVQAAKQFAMGKVAGAVPASVVASVERVLTTMFMTSMIKIAPAGLLMLAVAIGAGVRAQQQPKAQEQRIESQRFDRAKRVERTRPE